MPDLAVHGDFAELDHHRPVAFDGELALCHGVVLPVQRKHELSFQCRMYQYDAGVGLVGEQVAPKLGTAPSLTLGADVQDTAREKGFRGLGV